jgi:hypothetical protein
MLIAPVPSISAQQVQGALSVSGGSATDVLGVTSRAFSVTPSLFVSPTAHSVYALQASGTRFDNQQWSLTGSGAATFRAAFGRYFAASLNAGADATTTSYEVSYRTVTAMPTIEASAGNVGVFAGVVGAAASTTATSTSAAQRVPGLFGDQTIPGQTSSTTASRTAMSSVFGASVMLMQTGTVSLQLAGRSTPGIQRAIGSSVLSVRLGPAAVLQLSAGAYSENRLVGTPAGRFVNVGMSLRGGRSISSAPEPEGVESVQHGMTRLSLFAPNAARVEAAGDFSDWKPLVARRSENGVWYVDLGIPAGKYRYAFRVDGGAWTVPQGVPTVDDDFGGKSAWLVVSAPKQD